MTHIKGGPHAKLGGYKATGLLVGEKKCPTVLVKLIYRFAPFAHLK
jgi:hypothetical protein